MCLRFFLFAFALDKVINRAKQAFICFLSRKVEKDNARISRLAKLPRSLRFLKYSRGNILLEIIGNVMLYTSTDMKCHDGFVFGSERIKEFTVFVYPAIKKIKPLAFHFHNY